MSARLPFPETPRHHGETGTVADGLREPRDLSGAPITQIPRQLMRGPQGGSIAKGLISVLSSSRISGPSARRYGIWTTKVYKVV